MRRAGLPAVAAICEILDDTGAAARGAALDRIAERLGVMIITVNDIAAKTTHNEAGEHDEID